MVVFCRREVGTMPFEEFRQKGGRARFGFPAVTLLRSGGMALNGEANRALGTPDAVVLAYDKDEDRIGVRAGRGETFAYPVRKTTEDSYWIAAQGFLKYHAIVVKDTVRYSAALDGEYLAVSLTAEPVQREKRATAKGDVPMTDKE